MKISPWFGAVAGVLLYYKGINECHRNLRLLEVMRDEPSTRSHQHWGAIDKAIMKQKTWLFDWSFCPWPPSLPWRELPLDPWEAEKLLPKYQKKD
jgi:hypothetical protein